MLAKTTISDVVAVEAEEPNPVPTTTSGLRKVKPYWYPHKTMAKERWWGREILEIVSTEFRDRSMEYYRYALESGATTINGRVATPGTIVKNGDLIENVTHRHEPPVTARPIKIVLHDKEREFVVVDKPGSIPVHPSGRYFKNSLIEVLKDDLGLDPVYTVNRLDRLTSGLLILPTSASKAREMTDQFTRGDVKKEYIARCIGEFPAGEVICEQPLLTIDRQMGLNIIHPEGKFAKTIFNRLHYDTNTDTSVVHCQPVTGRSHQIRVHLQYMGHPIANDTLYADPHIWGPNVGKGGLDLTPSDARSAPAAPSHLSLDAGNPESLSVANERAPNLGEVDIPGQTHSRKLLPRETGHDIGAASPVPLSAETVGIITRLRHMKDEEEDWARWRDVAFRTAPLLKPQVMEVVPKRERERARIQRERRENSKKFKARSLAAKEEAEKRGEATTEADNTISGLLLPTDQATLPPTTENSNPTAAAALASLVVIDTGNGEPAHTEQLPICPECYVPLAPDPSPEKLYIFLHALRYTTPWGAFETDMPEWAAPGWEWRTDAEESKVT